MPELLYRIHRASDYGTLATRAPCNDAELIEYDYEATNGHTVSTDDWGLRMDSDDLLDFIRSHGDCIVTMNNGKHPGDPFDAFITIYDDYIE